MYVECSDRVDVALEVIGQTPRERIDLIQLRLFLLVLRQARVPEVLDHLRSFAAEAALS